MIVVLTTDKTVQTELISAGNVAVMEKQRLLGKLTNIGLQSSKLTSHLC